MTETEQWAGFLNAQGQLIVDVNEDGIEDSFYIEHVIKEGGLYIREFSFTLGNGDNFMISEGEQDYEDYFGELEKIELLDFDGVGAQELILMFDAHGAGGRGLHEIYVLWMDAERQIVAKQIAGWVQLSGKS